MKNQTFKPQSAYFPVNNSTLNEEFKQGQLLWCKLENDTQVLCKTYKNSKYQLNFLNKNSENVEILVDKSVLLLPEFRNEVSKEDFNIEILNFYQNATDSPIKQVTSLNEDPVEFKSITVDLFISGKNFKINFFENLHSIQRVLKGLLTYFTFTKNCLIDLEGLRENYGLERVLVTNVIAEETPAMVGYVGSSTVINIHNTFTWMDHTISNLIGVEELENSLFELITFDSPYKNRWHRSKFLIIGPSSTGKASLVRNLAIKLNCYLLEIVNNEIIGSLPGDTEATLRSIFQKAHKLAKLFKEQRVIIFIRNIDIICPKDVDPNNSSHIKRSSLLLMNLLEDITEERVIVLATTSNIEDVNPNLRRPGRINEEFFIKMPDQNERYKILSSLVMETFGICDFNELLAHQLSLRTNGYVAADLSLIVKHLDRGISKKNQSGTELTCDDYLSLIEEVLRKIRPSLGKGEFECKTVTDKTFDSIGGMEQLKQTIRLSVLGPLQRPDVYERFGLSPPRGILLYGPPGCAKTTFAQCIANETHMSFLSTSAAEVYSPYVGKAERYLVKMFNQARAMAPAIIFLDEIDALIGTRSGNTHDVQTRILSALLTEMDGIGGSVQMASSNKSKAILVIAATNRPVMIDGALMRPGRFDKLVHVPAPDEAGRLAVLKKQKIPFDVDVDLEEISRTTINFSGADLLNLCNEVSYLCNEVTLCCMTYSRESAIQND